jgi:broad specificity phosphatase PhoE
MGFGNWEGLTFSELMERFPEELKSRINDPVHFSPPGGESINDLRKRVIPKFNELIKRHRGESFCIVGHGGVNRIILLEALGADLYNFYRIEQDFACVNIVDFHPDGRIVVKLVNGTYSN